MKHNTLNIALLIGATIFLTNCGRKNFTQSIDAASVSPANSASSTPVAQPPQPNQPTDPTTPNTPPTDDSSSMLGQDICVSTIQWYDNFNWIPYVNDADCISKMKSLVRAETGDITMMNFEIRHLTKAQVASLSAQAKDSDDFIALFEAQTTPIYSFTSGWINE